MNYTERELAELAGWKVWQEGRKLAEKQSFTNIQSSNGVLSGYTKVNRRKTLVVVKQDENGNLVTKCSCDYHYQTGAICSHAIALILNAQSNRANEQKDSPKKDLEETQSTNNKHIAFNFTFLNLFKSDSKKPSYTCRLEVQSTDSSFAYSEQFTSFLRENRIPEKAGEVLLQLSDEQFAEVLECSQESGVTIQTQTGGKTEELHYNQHPTQFPLSIVTRSGVDLTLAIQKLDYDFKTLALGSSLLIWSPKERSLTSAGQTTTPHLHTLLTGDAVQLSVGEYLALEETLESCFSLSEVRKKLKNSFSTEEAQFHLELSGTSKKVRAQLRVKYPNVDDHLYNLKQEAISARPLRHDEKRDVFSFSDSKGELTAFQRLQRIGFDLSTLELAGESEILEFLVTGYETLKNDGWQIELKGSIRALESNLIKLKSRIEIDEMSASDEWFSFTYSFQNAAGKGLKHDEVQRLIQSGKQSFKLKNGRIAVLSKSQADTLHEVVNDCEARQSGGKFVVPRSQYKYISNISKNDLKEYKVNVLRVKKTTKFALPKSLSLRDYQEQGVQWVLGQFAQNDNALLADDMGLGKTVQTLVTIQHLMRQTQGTSLIICPASLTGNWESEARLWCPDLSVLVMSSPARKAFYKKLSEYDLIVTSYQSFLADQKHYCDVPLQIVALDEASMIRNAKSKVSIAVSEIEAQHKLALSGTPVENTARDLWSIFRFLQPNYLGSESHFSERFIKPLQKGGAATTSANYRLKAKIEPFMLRRTKSEVLHELPSKTIKVEHCPRSTTQITLSQQVLDQYHKELSESSTKTNRITMLTTLLRLRQIATDPKLVDTEQTEPSGKIKRLLEVIKLADSSETKVVVFSQFAQMLHLVAEKFESEGITYNILTGASQDRDKQINEFKSNPEQRVFLISLKAGGYGLNLTEANTVVHFDPWWNPAVENQATDRVYRMGQTLPVNVIKLITENSVEEKILALQKKKQDFINLVVDDGFNGANGLTGQEIEELIS